LNAGAGGGAIFERAQGGRRVTDILRGAANTPQCAIRAAIGGRVDVAKADNDALRRLCGRDGGHDENERHHERAKSRAMHDNFSKIRSARDHGYALNVSCGLRVHVSALRSSRAARTRSSLCGGSPQSYGIGSGRGAYGGNDIRLSLDMAGWRDSEGRTARERARQRGAEEHAAFMHTARRRPLTILKGFLGFAFILLLVFALITALR
jgi:hypothetical protein